MKWELKYRVRDDEEGIRVTFTLECTRRWSILNVCAGMPYAYSEIGTHRYFSATTERSIIWEGICQTSVSSSRALWLVGLQLLSSS